MVQKLTHARGVSGVYVIVHVQSGLAYIGSSSDIAQRWFNHRGKLRRQAHPNPRMQAAWDEHGEDAFRFVIVERVQVADLRVRELWWLEQGETWLPERGYNLSKRSDTVGHKFTPEQSARLSASLKGKKKSPEHRAAMAARVYTPEQMAGFRERMAVVGRAGKGRRKKAAHKRKIGLPQRGSGNHQSKLTETDVIEIHWRLALGMESKAAIGRAYGISSSTVRGIETGKSWAHMLPKQ